MLEWLRGAIPRGSQIPGARIQWGEYRSGEPRIDGFELSLKIRDTGDVALNQAWELYRLALLAQKQGLDVPAAYLEKPPEPKPARPPVEVETIACEWETDSHIKVRFRFVNQHPSEPARFSGFLVECEKETPSGRHSGSPEATVQAQGQSNEIEMTIGPFATEVRQQTTSIRVYPSRVAIQGHNWQFTRRHPDGLVWT